MRTPGFWYRERPGVLAHLLSPLGALYGAATAMRMARPGAHAPVPVICVGNLVAGGAGKTPVAILVAKLLREAGRTPFVLTRGHGGKIAGPTRVEPRLHSHRDVGDEPLLHAITTPTIVAVDRPAGAALAAGLRADTIVMDDGLQNPSLAKDLRIAVVDGGAGIGNGLCVPAGPLRAPLPEQWPHVDALIVIGEGAPGVALAQQAQARDLPVFHGTLVPDAASAAAISGREVVAFAGIARPEKFFATLQGLGARVVAARSFADHHRFRRSEILSLVREADQRGALLVTTQKDAVRLPARLDADIAARIRPLPVALVLAEEDALRALLASRVTR